MGVWIREIDPEYLKQLAKRAPAMPVAMFEYAVSKFLEGKEPSPVETREEIASLLALADELAGRLSALTWPAIDALDEAARKHGLAGLRSDTKGKLDALCNTAEMARREAESAVSRTNNWSLNTHLVADLVRGLRISGGEINSRPQGQLVLAFGIAHEIAGVTQTRRDVLVRNSLKTIEKDYPGFLG